MPRVNAKVVSPSSPEKQNAHYISKVFGRYLDFTNCESTHPLIQLYLFEIDEEDDLISIRNEIQWLLRGNKKYNPAKIEDFLIALDGLASTIRYYELTSWQATMNILRAEKKSFSSYVQELQKS